MTFMDFLIELLFEIVGGIIEIFFGEVPLRKLPKPIRAIILFVFWFGLSALFFWFAYLAFSGYRALSLIFFAAAIALAAYGVYSIIKSQRTRAADSKAGANTQSTEEKDTAAKAYENESPKEGGEK